MAVCVNRSPTNIAGKLSEPAANKSPTNARAGGLDAVIAFDVPGYSLRGKTVISAELEDLLDGLSRQCWGMMQIDRLRGITPAASRSRRVSLLYFCCELTL